MRTKSKSTLTAIFAAAAVLAALTGCSGGEEVNPPQASTSGLDGDSVALSHAESGAFWQELPDGEGRVLCVWTTKTTYQSGVGVSCDWASKAAAEAGE